MQVVYMLCVLLINNTNVNVKINLCQPPANELSSLYCVNAIEMKDIHVSCYISSYVMLNNTNITLTPTDMEHAVSIPLACHFI